MMEDYRFVLASNLFPKLDCPYCGAKKHWQRYYDKVTGEILPERHGLCDNATKCGEGINPYKDGYAKQVEAEEKGIFSSVVTPQKPATTSRKPWRPLPQVDPSFIPFEVLKKTRNGGWEKNIFIQNLLNRVKFPFPHKDIEKVIAHYDLGTVCNGYMSGAITFPYRDISGNVRTIQVKQFDESNHTTGQDFLHSIIEKYYQDKSQPLPGWLEAYLKNEKYVSCLFGEYRLTKYPTNPIGLIEAPKGAIYSTLYFGFPDNPKNLLWLAVYNLSSLTLEKCKVLKGRDVYLFPDLSKGGRAFKLWSDKAKEFSRELPGTRFEVSDYLEKNASESDRVAGADLADYLITQDWRKYRQNIGENERPKSEKGEKGETPEKRFFTATPQTAQKRTFYTFDEYAKSLTFDNGKLMVFGYPAEWDLAKDQVCNRTKDFIQLAVKNPKIFVPVASVPI